MSIIALHYYVVKNNIYHTLLYNFYFLIIHVLIILISIISKYHK